MGSLSQHWGVVRKRTHRPRVEGSSSAVIVVVVLVMMIIIIVIIMVSIPPPRLLVMLRFSVIFTVVLIPMPRLPAILTALLVARMLWLGPHPQTAAGRRERETCDQCRVVRANHRETALLKQCAITPDCARTSHLSQPRRP